MRKVSLENTKILYSLNKKNENLQLRSLSRTQETVLRNKIKLFGFTNNAAIAERKKVVKLGNLFSVKAPLFFFFLTHSGNFSKNSLNYKQPNCTGVLAGKLGQISQKLLTVDTLQQSNLRIHISKICSITWMYSLTFIQQSRFELSRLACPQLFTYLSDGSFVVYQQLLHDDDFRTFKAYQLMTSFVVL